MTELDPKSIVIRMPNWLGDAVMGTVALLAIRERYPSARITLLGRPAHEQLLRGLPYDAFITVDKQKGLRSLWRQGRRLARAKFDLGVLLPNSLSSALIFSFARIPHRIGYDLNKRGVLLTDRLRPEMAGRRRVPTPMPEYYTKLVGLLDCSPVVRRPELRVLADEEAELDEYLARRPLPAGTGPLILLNPGASFGPSKLWPGPKFAALARRLRAELDARLVVLAGPGEEELAGEISAALDFPHLAMWDEIIGLRPLKALVARSDLMVTTDAGPRHLAVAFDRPVVVLFGSTDPRYTNANLEKSVLVRRDDVDCSPCHLKVCPIDHRCMERIEPDEVFRGVTSLLPSGS